MNQEEKNAALFEAVARTWETGNLTRAMALLEEGADVDARNDRGETPLHIAAATNGFNETELLLSHGANPNLPDIDLNTPLHVAVRKATPGIARLLLAGKADPLLKNRWGKTPLEWGFDPEIREVLRNAEAMRRIRIGRTAPPSPVPGYFPE